MDTHTNALFMTKLEKTKNALIKNNMDARILDNVEEVQTEIKKIIFDGASVSVGGSQTLFECNLIEMLREMNIKYDDRYQEGLSRDQMLEVYRRAFMCDFYLSSSNAVTMNGELFNVDGNANRVAAITYGPDKVILVVGRNKVVSDLKEAEERVKNIAAPANCVRLNKDNACTHVGKCMDCNSPTRICCTYVTHKYQLNKDRIIVLLVNEDLGY